MSKFTVIFVLLLAAGAGVCSAGDCTVFPIMGQLSI